MAKFIQPETIEFNFDSITFINNAINIEHCIKIIKDQISRNIHYDIIFYFSSNIKESWYFKTKEERDLEFNKIINL